MDLALDHVKWYKINTQEPELAKMIERREANRQKERYITNILNKKAIEETAVEKDPSLRDFYDRNDPMEVITPQDKDAYEKYMQSLTEEEKELLQSGYNYYEIALSNVGGGSGSNPGPDLAQTKRPCF